MAGPVAGVKVEADGPVRLRAHVRSRGLAGLVAASHRHRLPLGVAAEVGVLDIEAAFPTGADDVPVRLLGLLDVRPAGLVVTRAARAVRRAPDRPSHDAEGLARGLRATAPETRLERPTVAPKAMAVVLQVRLATVVRPMRPAAFTTLAATAAVPLARLEAVRLRAPVVGVRPPDGGVAEVVPATAPFTVRLEGPRADLAAPEGAPVALGRVVARNIPVPAEVPNGGTSPAGRRGHTTGALHPCLLGLLVAVVAVEVASGKTRPNAGAIDRAKTTLH